jgi:hypothetical protein
LKSGIPIDVLVLALKGIEDMSSGIWFCKFDPMLAITPWFTLLFSSVNASQKALWVMKLSLLHDW